MKIVLTDSITVTKGDVDLGVFEKYGEVVYYDITPPEKVAERIKDADAVLCNKTLITKEAMESAKKLKYIGILATGYNNVDMEEANRRGITVCNAGSYSTDAVSQQVFAYILNHYNKVSKYADFVNKGGWQESETFAAIAFRTRELAGKKLGIIGYGSIGQKVAQIANAFSMQVLIYTRTPKKDSTVEFVDLDTLLKESDIVTVHCPLNKQSENMFDRETFSKMKTGAYFINTSRGGVLEEDALKDALLCGKLSGAAIDVLNTEPQDKESMLIRLPNLTVTPHIAWAAVESRIRLLNIVEDNLKNYIAGTPKNVVK